MLLLQFLLLCFLGATLVQLAAWLGLYPRLRVPARPPPTEERQPAALPVSVVICARNEAANLQRYLPAVLQQQYAHFEVVVVDDASTDDTPAVLEALSAQFAVLRTVRIDRKMHGGKKQALALGVDVATFDHLVLTDADCEPASDRWLEAMAAGFQTGPNTEIVLGVAPFRRAPGLLAGWARFESVFTALQYGALATAGLPYMGVGRNLAWTRAVYTRAGGFAAHLDRPSGDDDLLVNAAARRDHVVLCAAPHAFMYSDAPPTWPAWWRQKRRHLGAATAYRPVHRVVLGILALSHTLHYGLAAILLIAQFGTVPVLTGYAARMLVVLTLHARLLPRWRAADLLPLLPLYDGLLAVYYGAFVPWGLWGRRSAVRWKQWQ